MEFQGLCQALCWSMPHRAHSHALFLPFDWRVSQDPDEGGAERSE